MPVRSHAEGRRIYGANSIPPSYGQGFLHPSTVPTPQVEDPNLAVPYLAPASTVRHQPPVHASSQPNRTSSSVFNHSYTSSCSHNDSQPTASSPPSSLLPHSIPSSSRNDLNTSTIVQGNTLYCNGCDAKFTGQYGRGNLARHVKLKHAKANKVPYICRIAGCSKPFARSDARTKHERKPHMEVYSEPTEWELSNTVSSGQRTVRQTSAMMVHINQPVELTSPTFAQYQPIEYLRGGSSQQTPSQYWPEQDRPTQYEPSQSSVTDYYTAPLMSTHSSNQGFDRRGWDQFTTYEPSQNSTTDYHTAPFMSTQSSHQGFDNRDSSQYDRSPQTGPSSVLGQLKNIFFSPHIPAHSFSHLSNTPYAPEHTNSQAIQSDPMDFPKAPAQPDDPRFIETPMPQVIDPRILQWPARDSDILNGSFEGHENDDFCLPDDWLEGYEDDDLYPPNTRFEGYKDNGLHLPNNGVEGYNEDDQ